MREKSTPSIPYGYCQCGCGERAPLATKTSKRNGHVQGQPMKYILGHYRKRRDVEPPNPSGRCFCGCGEVTPLASMTYASLGILAGHHVRYVRGHEHRRKGPAWLVDPASGCWNWQGGKDEKGYALDTDNGRTRRVHITHYEAKHGPVPDGFELDHICRNRGCVNPDHVEPVTHTVNMRRSLVAKLTEADVQTIRALRGTMTQRAIATRYGVTDSAISAIMKGKSWKDV